MEFGMDFGELLSMVPYYIVLYSTMQFGMDFGELLSMVAYYIVLYSTVEYGTVLYSTV
jgi:hypothetical protein